jgi:tetratricopeptide (TPR) repeat protein
MSRAARLLILGGAWIASLVLPFKSYGVTAVVAEVKGSVSVADPAELGPEAEIRPFQVLAVGAVLNLGIGDRVGLVCSNERLLLLTGPTRWSLTAQGCASGPELPVGSYEDLAPRAGRLQRLSGAAVPGAGALVEAFDDPRMPLLLAPRGVNVREERPILHWRRARGAQAYLLRRQGLSRPVEVSAVQAGCEVAPAWDHVEVCTLALPPDWPGIAPGQSYRIQVEAVASGGSSTVIGEVLPPAVRRLSELDEVKLERRLRAISSSSLGTPGREVLTAAQMARFRLYDVAIATLRQALTAGGPPEVLIALGDLYQAVGLLPWAERSYHRAIVREASPAPRAAAVLGLGWILYQRERFDEARGAFRRAQSLYVEEGCEAEAEAAAASAVEAERRLVWDRPKDSFSGGPVILEVSMPLDRENGRRPVLPGRLPDL